MNPLTNKKYPRYKGMMPYCDWIAFSCIRGKENGFRNYNGENDESFDGSTVPSELVKLMKEILDFKSVVDYTNVTFNKGTLYWDGENSSSREIAKMEELYFNGYTVIMLINTNMLYNKKSGLSSTIEHWVVFEGVIGGTISWDKYDFKVFTWGEIRNVIINPEVFSSNFYGYIYMESKKTKSKVTYFISISITIFFGIILFIFMYYIIFLLKLQMDIQ